MWELGQQASGRPRRAPGTRQFADGMVADHAKASAKLLALAGKNAPLLQLHPDTVTKMPPAVDARR